MAFRSKIKCKLCPFTAEKYSDVYKHSVESCSGRLLKSIEAEDRYEKMKARKAVADAKRAAAASAPAPPPAAAAASNSGGGKKKKKKKNNKMLATMMNAIYLQATMESINISDV